MVEIVIFALIAAFLGLRLYNVLGKRTGHEQTMVEPAERARPAAAPARAPSALALDKAEIADPATSEGAVAGVRALAAADAGFDPGRFLAGASSAYRMVLEAFWRGDNDAIADLANDEVRAAFAAATAERNAAGHVTENRLIRIEQATIESARIENNTALVAVRFEADVAALTRDADGNVVGGSLSDAITTRDIWTFSRALRSPDPNWTLVETDEA